MISEIKKLHKYFMELPGTIKLIEFEAILCTGFF